MKKPIVFITLLFFFISITFALPNNLNISLSPQFGLFNGSIGEYVYDDSYKLSYLDWDIENILKTGLSTDCSYTFSNNTDLKLSMNLSFLIPGNSSQMQDYDWLDTNNPGNLTNYSWHENSLTQGICFSSDIEWFFLSFLSLSLGFDTQKISFTGSNGYYQYATYNRKTKTYEQWTEDIEKSVFSGDVITYSLTNNYFKFGLSFSYKFFNKIDAKFTTWYVPYLKATGDDHHILTDAYYQDRMESLLDPSKWIFYGYIGYKFDQNNSLGINATAYFFPLSLGDSYSSNSGKSDSYIYNGSLGGSTLSALDIQLLYTYKF